MKKISQMKKEFLATVKKDRSQRSREEVILLNALVGLMFETNLNRYVAAAETCLFLMGILKEGYTFDTLDRNIITKKFLGFTWTQKETIPNYFERKCREVLTERGVL
jgi:hypothetical protein